jgi:hypothetical protein
MKRNPLTALSAATLVAALILGFCGTAEAAADTISLAGRWRFQLDPQDSGLRERWFERSLRDHVTLPGALPAQGIGDDVSVDTRWTGGIVDKSWYTAPEYAAYRRPGNVKVPFWLQPEKYYAGAAWYQRDVRLPESWRGHRVMLSLERAHWETRVWVDGRLEGTNNSLSTPHTYDLGLLPPGDHTLTIRVDNRLVIDVGENSHSVSDHTQGNWNGIVGRIDLDATAPVWIEDLQVFPDAAHQSVKVKGRIGNATGQPGNGTVRLRVDEAVERGAFGSLPPAPEISVSWQAEGGSFETTIPLHGTPKLWDEFTPHLYNLEARLVEQDTWKVVLFGFRDVTTEGTQFLVNGRKTFIRGTLECAIFPKTGYTPTDLDSWRKVIQAAKAHGLNNLRFHSHCPPEAAFLAADELGMYLHVECASWANQSTTLGDGKPVDRWVYEEAERILRAYGNHPSFVFLLYGNEPGGSRHAAYLTQWLPHFRAQDPRRLYSGGAGWPQLAEDQFHVTPDPRIQAWGGGLKSRLNAHPPETVTDYRDYIRARSVPVISHEIGQWCVYPNFDEMRKYRGYLKPRNFEIFQDTLKAHHQAGLARLFLFASGKLQTLCYKEDIESALRTPGMGGFQLLDLHDFPGQGTALVGVLDPFWEGKGYVTPEAYRRFCNATVPLARLSKRVFTADETLTVPIEIAHFGSRPLVAARPWYRLLDDAGRRRAEGRLPEREIPVDNGIALGTVNLDLGHLPAPAHYRLAVGLAGTPCENDWSIWVYPPQVDLAAPPEVKVTSQLDDETVSTLEQGGRVLLLVPPARVAPDPKLGKVQLGFSSIFWNTAWTGRQAPHTLGILCNPKHPLFARFPTDLHSDWHWWYLVSRAGALILDDLPPGLRPTVQVIDDWFTARRLALVFEAKVGRGKLAVCSIDLEHDLENNAVARQFRHSLLQYLASRHFKPRIGLTVAQVRQLMTP